MRTLTKVIACALAATALPGCGGGGPPTYAGMTEQQARTAAKQLLLDQIQVTSDGGSINFHWAKVTSAAHTIDATANDVEAWQVEMKVTGLAALPQGGSEKLDSAWVCAIIHRSPSQHDYIVGHFDEGFCP